MRAKAEIYKLDLTRFRKQYVLQLDVSMRNLL